MKEYPFPFIPPFPQNNLDQRLSSIESELKEINEKLNKLIKQKQNSYIQNDDNLYMLWAQMCSFFVYINTFYGILNYRKWGIYKC